MLNQGMLTSKSAEWTTPDALFRALDAEFHFDLDPASTDRNAKCSHHYTKEQNGLTQPWGGCRVFCNPPYGTELPKWVRKAFSERDEAEVIVLLIPARTDTRWFHDCIYGRAEIRFIKGRIRFGDAQYNAPFPSMIVIYRKGDRGKYVKQGAAKSHGAEHAEAE